MGDGRRRQAGVRGPARGGVAGDVSLAGAGAGTAGARAGARSLLGRQRAAARSSPRRHPRRRGAGRPAARRLRVEPPRRPLSRAGLARRAAAGRRRPRAAAAAGGAAGRRADRAPGSRARRRPARRPGRRGRRRLGRAHRDPRRDRLVARRPGAVDARRAADRGGTPVSELGALTRPGPDAPPGTPSGRRTRTSLWGLPPWTRAPLLGLLSPGAVVAVLVTSAILACAVASAPLFLSSAKSAALQQQLAPPKCAEASWPAIGGNFAMLPGAPPADLATAADAYRGAFAAQGSTSTRSLLINRSIGVSGNPQGGMPVADPRGVLLTLPANVLWRPGATDHVHVVESGGGPGVWLPASYAAVAKAHPGDRITMAGAPVTVAGVYTDLYDTVPGAYWCDYGDLYLNLASANTAPPPLVLASDQATFFQLASAAQFFGVTEAVPTARTGLSVTEGRSLIPEAQRVATAKPVGAADAGTATVQTFGSLELTEPITLVGAGIDQRLPEAVARASLIERGLRGPVIPVAVAGGLLALVLVASAGSFWADRRENEVRLLAARGVGPVPLAGKAALELGLPALAGAAVGWAASRLLTAAIGPADDLDPSAAST